MMLRIIIPWNGDYPYNQVTAVDGTISAGAHEYPNDVIGARDRPRLGDSDRPRGGPQLFYGILGSNERDNADDEGINSFNETRYILTKYGNDKGLNSVGNTTSPSGLT